MDAALVYDGGDVVNIPIGMGTPRHDQLLGTPLEQLGETAGRICYDSLGQGRNSDEYHQHIIDVNNTSVYEHLVTTIGFMADKPLKMLPALLNRKGIWVEFGLGCVEVTLNFRSILEWDRKTGSANGLCGTDVPWQLGEIFQYYGSLLAPMIVKSPNGIPVNPFMESSYIKSTNLTIDQAHVTLWLYGSRGFTHEQVRHRFAISQRSTRYVDEDGSPYIVHPLITRYLEDPETELTDRSRIVQAIEASMEADRQTYRTLVKTLQRFCQDKMGMDKTNARKQARGASRGYLGNALASEMLFTTSVRGWQWILANRKNKAADAEIRAIYTPGLRALQSSQFGQHFSHLTLKPSPDGIGEVLA